MMFNKTTRALLVAAAKVVVMEMVIGVMMVECECVVRVKMLVGGGRLEGEGRKPPERHGNGNATSRREIGARLSRLFENDQIARIMGYGDYQLGNVVISRGPETQICTQFLDDMLKSSPICLLSKASKTKSWLWLPCYPHLNFGTLKKLAKDGLARGIPRLKFQKDHLCSACALGKSKKSSHQPNVEDTNQEKLYLLHMDLCGPMRVAYITRE
ncbi:retrovirus-related pol polyprotein from transposon TNT 1-94 [Tanacetum coccineum]